MTKILCFGDSITKGYTCYGTQYYPYSEYLKGELSKDFQYSTFEIVEHGVDGERVVNEMEERLKNILDNNIYDYVILLGGLNDMADIMVNKKETDDVIDSFKNIYKLLEDNVYIKKFIHITIPNCILDCKNNGNNKYLKSKNIINNNICNIYSSKKIMLDLRDHENYQLNSLYLNEEQKDFYWDDGLHFTKEGYILLAKNIYKVFKKEIQLD